MSVHPDLIRTLIIIVLICTSAVCAGMVAIVKYNANTRQDTRTTRILTCRTAELIHSRAPEYIVPKECP